MAETRIGVIGCGGRMGRMLVADIVATEGCTLAGGVARPGSDPVGQDLGELAGIGRFGMPAGDSTDQLLRDCDVAIEFTAPAATRGHAALAAELGRPVVIGTTGLSGEQEKAIRDAARHIPVVWAANTSLGINLLFGLVEQVAQRLGPDWDIEICEMHHRGKVDAPSGTALGLGRAAAAARGVALDDVALLYFAFRLNYRSARQCETLRLADDQFTVERVGIYGERRLWRFQPFWLRVVLEERLDDSNRLLLASHGRSLAIGDFLPPPSRRELAMTLREVLACWRAALNPANAPSGQSPSTSFMP